MIKEHREAVTNEEIKERLWKEECDKVFKVEYIKKAIEVQDEMLAILGEIRTEQDKIRTEQDKIGVAQDKILAEKDKILAAQDEILAAYETIEKIEKSVAEKYSKIEELERQLGK